MAFEFVSGSFHFVFACMFLCLGDLILFEKCITIVDYVLCRAVP